MNPPPAAQAASDETTRRAESEAQFRQLADVTARKEEELRHAIEARYRTLFEYAPDGIIIADPAGRYLDVNASLCRMLGYARDELIGRTGADIVAPDEIGLVAPALDAITGQGGYHREWRFRRKEGSIFTADVMATLMPDGNLLAIIRDSTARKQAEEQLQWKTAFFEAQVNSAQDGMLIVDREGRMVLQNQRMIDLWKIPPLVAGQAEDRVRLDWVTGQIKDRTAFLAKVAHLYAHPDEVSRDELDLVDGRIFDRYSAPVRGGDGKYYGRIWAFRDVTEQKRAEERIVEQAAFLDKARDAIQVRDMDGRVIYWNEGAARMYGWTRAEALGRQIAQSSYVDPAKFEEVTSQTISQGEWHGEVRHLAKGGRELMAESRCTLIRDGEGRPKAILSINTDITEKKKIEAQFLRAQRMESIGTLAGGIAHDLNNILTPIMMSIEFLQSISTDPRARKVLSSIEVSAQRGADIVRQVLSFARGIEGERIEIQPQQLLKELEGIIQDTFPKNIRLHFLVPADTWTIVGDPTQVHQILLNLCVNARDAMPQGGDLTVAVENCAIDAQFSAMTAEIKPGRYVNINVTDTGTGIPRDILDKIFEPFFTTKDLNKGTGLGLSTVMAIVKSHGGAISVASGPGRGTTFKVYLPASAAAAEPGDAAEADRLPRGRGETILVVDDEAPIRFITRQTLEAFGYRVLTAVDGADALGVYVQNQAEVALVLTDMMMPVMAGPALIQALLRINPGLKIVAASGMGSTVAAAGISLGGAKRFLSKPYMAETVLEAVRAALDEG